MSSSTEPVHNTAIEQRIELYTGNAKIAVEEIEQEIQAGWRTVSITSHSGYLIVVYERHVTTCGKAVTCLGCLAAQ